MIEIETEQFPSLSRNNFHKTKGVLCGCYFCIEIIPGDNISDTCDNGSTALCPKCGIDSLLPGITDRALLSKACEMWFSRVI